MAALAVTSVLGTAGCTTRTPQRTETGYCAAVEANLAELSSPSVAAQGDVSRTVALYEKLAKAAPLEVEKEWDVLTIAYQTAATVVASDPASMQRAADTIRSAEPAARTIADYTRRLCTVDIGASTVPTTPPAGSAASDPNASTSRPGTSDAPNSATTGVNSSPP